MRKPKKIRSEIEIPEYLQKLVNKAVRYYSDGWYIGYLEGFTKMGAAKIRPIGAIGGQQPHSKIIPAGNIERIENG